ncbi:MAG: hypothetical protein LBR74_05745 [Eubacterium sp.]|nr:hypothetical protein [Eubacterium sp.]
MKILICGYGNIGRHIHDEFVELSDSIDIYDPFIERYKELKGTDYNYAFICVPTDMMPDGSADISAVEDATSKINADIIILKSAVPVGTTDYLINKYNKNIILSPEYYGTTQHSESSSEFLILGGCVGAAEKVAQLYYKVKNGGFIIRFTDAKTAELAKYMENCFLALKVTFCNEFADVATNYGICYSELREIFIMDRRMGSSHTFVYADKPYYDSHCLNKDIPAFIRQAQGKAPLMTAVDLINKERRTVNN